MRVLARQGPWGSGVSPPPTPLRRVPAEAPKEIDMLIAMCTDPDPSLRPTAKEIIQHIINSPSEKPGK